MKSENAESTTHASMLMVAIVVIMGTILLVCLIRWCVFPCSNNALAPAFIRIISINHGGYKLESQVIIRSFALEELDNNDLRAVIKVNDKVLLAYIYTLHGTDFIPTHHIGVKYIGGAGCSGQFFSPQETITIDLKNGYISPGDKVELCIYKKSHENNLPPITGNLMDNAYMEQYTEEYLFNHIPGYQLYSQSWYTA